MTTQETTSYSREEIQLEREFRQKDKFGYLLIMLEDKQENYKKVIDDYGVMKSTEAIAADLGGVRKDQIAPTFLDAVMAFGTLLTNKDDSLTKPPIGLASFGTNQQFTQADLLDNYWKIRKTNPTLGAPLGLDERLKHLADLLSEYNTPIPRNITPLGEYTWRIRKTANEMREKMPPIQWTSFQGRIIVR